MHECAVCGKKFCGSHLYDHEEVQIGYVCLNCCKGLDENRRAKLREEVEG